MLVCICACDKENNYNGNNSNTSTPNTSFPKEDSTSKESKPIHTHSYSKKLTEPTCTEKGYTTYTCSCGDVYQDDYVDPTHTYSQYKCIKCGALDKSNFSNILKEWLSKNGVQINNTISIHYMNDSFENGTDHLTFLQYYAGHLCLVASADKGDYEMFVLLYVPQVGDDTYNYEVSVSKNNNATKVISFNGKISASSYTASTKGTCENYVGEASYQSQVVDATRLAINRLLKDTDACLTKEKLGFNIKDMGFTAY